MSMTQGELAANETVQLISADKVEGTPVYNPEGEQLGTVQKLMIDKITGRVSYAVMSFGGFLGLGEEYHPLPWEVLKYDTGLEGYVVNLSRESLEEAPRFAVGDEPDWRDRAYSDRVYGYYDMPPYWTSL